MTETNKIKTRYYVKLYGGRFDGAVNDISHLREPLNTPYLYYPPLTEKQSKYKRAGIQKILNRPKVILYYIGYSYVKE